MWGKICHFVSFFFSSFYYFSEGFFDNTKPQKYSRRQTPNWRISRDLCLGSFLFGHQLWFKKWYHTRLIGRKTCKMKYIHIQYNEIPLLWPPKVNTSYLLKTLFEKLKLFFSSFPTPSLHLIRDHIWDCPKSGL